MEYWLPVIYMAVMGLALFIYVILDGYDLGVGMLLPFAEDADKDIMVASIGPFWDANETWIVLGIGVLLIAFPTAHGIILSHLYLPVTIMIMGLILRGVAFDLRVKAGDHRKRLWNRAFFIGSLVASTAQGWMLGAWVTGLQGGLIGLLFGVLIAIALPALYLLLGCGWLVMKTEGPLQSLAVRWARVAIWPMGLGLLLISISTPLVSTVIADKWFSLPNAVLLSPIPIASALCFFWILHVVHGDKLLESRHGWTMFAATVGICVAATLGLAYSVFPEVVIGQLTIWEAASSVDSLLFTLVGVVITLPVILFYTVYVYRVFHGKATGLSYE
ncbi:cytochrome BD ubiquinol oxidase subunit II [Kineobactrum sediminis]|uniref:Cytochrome BD ubiquinol oxidase subunit II n=1 Tax=Kineobactrum sediminis TaxID=1905677 RepID=A0A2N5Y6K5_9GAMM|nr:cytochrome d ubiquinol oxidase subunit II [Kineobactrum sediminis]PLW84017.1 cytochrome BD ubiquinol oxidase subunit II [Kineobactrum sediminis]